MVIDSQPEAATPATTHATRVTIADFDMPFMSIVGFMLKVALAAIPAALVLFVVFAVLTGILTGLTGAIR